MSHDLRDLSSLTRDWTQVPAVKTLGPNHWAIKEFPVRSFSKMRETGPGKFRTKTRTWSVLPATSLSRISQESRSPPPRPRDLHFFSSLSQCKPWQGLTRWFWVRILLALYACWIWYKASGGWNGWGQPAPMSPWVEAGKAPGSSASLVSGEERLTSLSGHNILSQEYQSRDRESAFGRFLLVAVNLVQIFLSLFYFFQITYHQVQADCIQSKTITQASSR